MSQKSKVADLSIDSKLRQSDNSWEHREKAVYTVDSLEKEILTLLAPKKQETENKRIR